MVEMINPYIAGNPVTGEEMFFGREDVFTFIRQTLRGQHRDQVIVLYGQRRTGKTSILYQMHRYLDPRYLCIFIDLHGLSMESEATFLWELANQIRRVLGRDYGIALPAPDRGAFEADPRSYFANDFLDQAWQAVGDRHILLMLDEAVRLQEQVQAGRLDRAIFEYLRHLMQHYEQLNFLFSLGSGLEQMEKEYAFLFNVALYKKISFLERPAAVELITRPVRDYYQVEPAAVDRILAVTAGHPYYTQLLCHSLFNRWRQQGSQAIAVGDVEAVLEEVVERGLAVLKHTWEESTPGEKAVVAGLAAAMGERNRPVDRAEATRAWERLDVTLPAKETAKAMRSLTARDLISGDEQVRFAVDLQHYWVRKFQRLEWVREEIRDQMDEWPAKPATEPPMPRRQAQERAPRKAANLTPASKGAWLAIGGLAAILVAALLLAAALDWGPFDSGRTAASPASAGFVVPGGEANKVNDLTIAGEAVWAATDGGLVRWSADGHGTLIRGADIGFSDDSTQTVVAAPDGSLWIGGGGVSHVEPTDGDVRFLAFYDRDDDLGMARVRALMVDDGTLWAGGASDRESPLSQFDGQEWHYDALSLEEAAGEGVELEIWSLLSGDDGRVWLGLYWDGILGWDGENWSHWGAEESVGGRDLEDARIRALIEDDNGMIWAAASDRGLLRYLPEAESWERVDASNLSAPVTAIAQFDDGTLWSAGDDWLARSDDGGLAWEKVATTEDGIGWDISGLVQDDDGRVWLGAYDGGVSVLEDGVWQNLQR